MKRIQFLLTAAAATPLAAFATVPFSSFSILKGLVKPGDKPFKVEASKSRFEEAFTFRKVNSQDIKVSKKDTAGQISIIEYTGREKIGPPLHIHFEQDEIFYVADGEYRFVVGENEMQAKLGDTIFLPRNMPHTWTQKTDMGRLVYILQPAGTFEEFLHELQTLKDPTAENLQDIHLKHGMKILGPPL